MYQSKYLFNKSTAEETVSANTPTLRDIVREEDISQENAKHDLFLYKLEADNLKYKKKCKKCKKKLKKNKKALEKAKRKIEHLESELKHRESVYAYPFNVAPIMPCMDARRNGGVCNAK